ncbi:tRNA(Ile)-lysidine synthetase, partial [Mycolicibacterium insubricum]|nr:tRNA(Ile)-lysidine synthetase [Mycolicibacterium insubricum]
MSWCVALSGGADSLALTAAAAHLRPTTALIVDHRLQPGSADIAARAAGQRHAPRHFTAGPAGQVSVGEGGDGPADYSTR